MEEEKRIKELEEKLSLCEKERDEYLNGWKRAKADLINSKKEWENQLSGLDDYIKTDCLKQFLSLLDALDAARDAAGWREIHKLAEGILKKNGVEEIDALGQEFDPAYHEAVGEMEGEAHKVVEVVQKGYKINNRVIRAAKVKVGKQL